MRTATASLLIVLGDDGSLPPKTASVLIFAMGQNRNSTNGLAHHGDDRHRWPWMHLKLLWDDDADRASAELFPGDGIDDHGLHFFSCDFVN